MDPVPVDAGGITAPLSGRRSTFVTVIAWLFIVGGGFAALMAIAQAVMLSILDPQFWSGRSAVRGLENAPAIVRLMLGNVRLMFVAFWILSLFTFAAAVGLLRRKNWARLYFIYLLAFGIVWTLGGLLLQFTVTSDWLRLDSRVPEETARQFNSMKTAMLIVNVVFSVAFALLFAWIMWRLQSIEIKQEFRAL